jgi:hypothetical protein
MLPLGYLQYQSLALIASFADFHHAPDNLEAVVGI